MNKVFITGLGGGLGKFFLAKLGDQYSIYGSDRNYGDLQDKETLLKIEKSLVDLDIDIFINNAAIYSNKKFEEYSNEEIEKIISVNITSQIKLIQAAYKFFLSKGKGLIININSLTCKNPGKHESLYSASKIALKSISNSIQMETRKVKFLDVYVGAMKTQMSKTREDYNELINPDEVVMLIKSLIDNKLSTCFPTEITIRRYT